MATDYEITSLRQTQSIGASGQLVDEVEATFSTVPEGAAGLVRVPKAGDWSTALTQAIQAEVQQLKAVYAG